MSNAFNEAYKAYVADYLKYGAREELTAKVKDHVGPLMTMTVMDEATNFVTGSSGGFDTRAWKVDEIEKKADEYREYVMKHLLDIAFGETNQDPALIAYKALGGRVGEFGQMLDTREALIEKNKTGRNRVEPITRELKKPMTETKELVRVYDYDTGQITVKNKTKYAAAGHALARQTNMRRECGDLTKKGTLEPVCGSVRIWEKDYQEIYNDWGWQKRLNME